MLRSIRDNIKGTWAKIILGLIIIPFVFFGVESMFGGSGVPVMAEVNGEEIDQQQFEMEKELLRRELLNEMGEDIDFSALEDSRLAQPALERLIQRVLLDQMYEEMQIAIPERMVDASIMQAPALQENGQFSNARLELLLSQQGFSLSMLRERLANDMKQDFFRQGLGASNFAIPGDADLLLKIIGETRITTWVEVPVSNLEQSIELEESDLQSYYTENSDQFMSELAVVVDYIELDVQEFLEPVDEQRIESEYRNFVGAYESEERRRISHILLETNGEQTLADATAQLESFRSEIEAGAEFSELARQHSADPGSAQSGGDLGFVDENSSYPQAFVDAAFALEEGGLEIVETDAGVHLLLLTELDADEPPSLDSQRESIRTRLQKSAAEKVYVTKLEELKDLVFNADGLNQPAEELGLTVQRSEQLKKQGNVGLFANASLSRAAFSPEVIEDGHNSEVIELSDSQSVVMRVEEVFQPRQLSLEEVMPRVSDAVMQNKRADLMLETLSAIEAAANSGDMLEAVAIEKGFSSNLAVPLSRRSTEANAELLREIFALPRSATGEGKFNTFISSTGNGYVFSVSSVTEEAVLSMSESEREGVYKSLQNIAGATDYRSAIQELSRKAAISRK